MVAVFAARTPAGNQADRVYALALRSGCRVFDSRKKGSPNLDVANGHGIDIERALIEHGEIGVLAGLDAAYLTIQVQEIGRPEGDGMERLLRSQLFALPQYAAFRSHPVDGAPHRMQAAERGNRSIGVQREGDAEREWVLAVPRPLLAGFSCDSSN